MSISIVLADDHTLMRAGLRALLEHEHDLRVSGEAANGREALRCVEQLSPDLIIMDVRMPELNGVEATRQIARSHAATRVLGLSMHSDRRFVSEMLRAGAAGYLLKDAACDELIRAVRAVLSGKTYISPEIAASVVGDLRNPSFAQSASAISTLTSREKEVLQMIAEGFPTRAIAEKLHVSIKTVETHRQHIMRKLDLHSVAQLTKIAVSEGLTDI